MGVPAGANGRRVRFYAAAFAAVVLLGAGLLALTRDAGAGSTVRLLPAEAPGPQPFTGPAWGADPDVTVPDGAGAGGAGTEIERVGDEPGLYGGTRGETWCDPDELVRNVKQLPEKAWAWAGVLGLEPADIEPFIAELTPVVLLADTGVTDHGFAEDAEVATQAVLQAGTVVLVDRTGVPRVRCASGSPLDPPLSGLDAGPFDGDEWRGFDPDGVQRVKAADEPVDELELVDLRTGKRFRRLVGPEADDSDVPKPGRERPAEATLVVVVRGPGSVRGQGAKEIDCGTDCRHVYAVGDEVRLRATPAPGGRLTAWSGACRVPPSSAECVVRIGADPTEVTIQFTGPPEPAPVAPSPPPTDRPDPPSPPATRAEAPRTPAPAPAPAPTPAPPPPSSPPATQPPPPPPTTEAPPPTPTSRPGFTPRPPGPPPPPPWVTTPPRPR